MEAAKTQRENNGPYALGWRYGLGMGAAIVLCLVVAAALFWAAKPLLVSSNTNNLSAPVNQAELASPQSSNQLPTSSEQGFVTVNGKRFLRIAPDTESGCLSRSGGLINEAYQRCLSGYTLELDSPR